MALSEEDRRRIEEEEYRELVRQRLAKTVRLEADVHMQSDQRMEVRGVGTEIYHDAKAGAAKVGNAVVRLAVLLFVGMAIAAFLSTVLLQSGILR